MGSEEASTVSSRSKTLKVKAGNSDPLRNGQRAAGGCESGAREESQEGRGQEFPLSRDVRKTIKCTYLFI
jgi:hypothetical protein